MSGVEASVGNEFGRVVSGNLLKSTNNPIDDSRWDLKSICAKGRFDKFVKLSHAQFAQRLNR